MNIGFWNVRGMNLVNKQLVVNRFLHTNNVGLFGLTETKIKPTNLNKAMTNVFGDWSISTNSSHHFGGRIWILWKPYLFDVTFLEYDAQYIHMRVIDKQSQLSFFHTIVYAFNGISERESLWSNLQRLSSLIQAPWAIGGDFNCVLVANERLGGRVSTAETEPFQTCLDNCNMMDIQAIGAFYTWNNKQPPETRVYSRIDRFFWIEGSKMYRLVRKLKMLKADLKNLNMEYFSDVENKADIAQAKLIHIQKQLISRPGDEELMQQEYNTYQESKQLHQAKMDFLKQKAKAH
ncbi:uncharacterized protein LOC141620554 [Silene latifolia]|uniref:uncharacterized protein LOC141620554 n=1 Tax=Silene latifolia TaxID=37657 RepID=UPI003D770090